MLAVFRKLNLAGISLESINNSYVNLQSIRWRKPRCVPTAKSKRFRVPQTPILPEDEQIEIKRLFNNYRNHLKSVRRYLINKHSKIEETTHDPEELLKIINQDFERCSAINDKWNAEQKILREQRIAKQLEDDIKFAKQRIELELEKEQQSLERVEEIVRKQKEASVDFITAENIDKAIDQALAQETDYNFAVDINGEKLHGRETRPEKSEKKVALKQ
ncbi:probable 28S ribosomal protein S26, mitochondrial [Sitophilus oryzae]|uniref:Small ribosomal subunit protein mS26 n=1 Tax=Sitophilus oryzae TaxID=7048 RepID=A0A6J2YR82_SITOR|nr:probable 28S ribosomal protein S26, mitochondrial [Sitophilus oryzae]